MLQITAIAATIKKPLKKYTEGNVSKRNGSG